MTIDQAYRLVSFIANKKQYGQIRPEDFNLIAPQAQLELVMKMFSNTKTYQPGMPVPVVGHEMTLKTQNNLRPLLVTDDDSGNGWLTVNNLLMAGTSGATALPSDFLYLNNVERLDGTSISHLTTSEIGKRRKSQVKPPTTTYPVMAVDNEGVKIYPDLTDVVLFYIKEPVTPVWAYTLSGGTVPVYDSGTSVDFELPKDLHNEVCMLILQHIGINLSHNELTQYAQIKEKQGV